MVTLSILMPVVLFVSWGVHLDAGFPEPANTVLMLLNPLLGVLALVLLPRVLNRETQPGEEQDPRWERRALITGAVVVLFSGIAGSALLPGIAAVVSLAGRRRPAWVAAAALSFAAAVAMNFFSPGETIPWYEALIATVLLAAVLVLIGLYRGGRRALLRSLRQEADAAHRGQEAREAQARQEERTAIAREMHDTVSHRLALVSLHAGALEYRDDLSPEQAREAAAVIRQGAQEAADELRAALQVLRSDPADTRPAPTLADLTDLVDGVRAAGAEVALEVRVPDDVEIPPSVTAHLYRVLQESLTNAVKHAPGKPIAVRVDVVPGEGATLAVGNPLAGEAEHGLGARVGLIGLRERVALAGGRFDAGPRGDRFVLETWVPWTH